MKLSRRISVTLKENGDIRCVLRTTMAVMIAALQQSNKLTEKRQGPKVFSGHDGA